CHEFDRSHSIAEKTSALGTCWYCAVREYLCRLNTAPLSKFKDDGEKWLKGLIYGPKTLRQKVLRFNPPWWWEIVNGQRVQMSTGIRECCHNEPSQKSCGIVLPFFMGLHPRSTRRFYSLYRHD